MQPAITQTHSVSMDVAIPSPIAEFFKVSGLQTLQDDLTRKMRVASIMTYPNGVPITKPSNFSRLCQIIRKTEKGGANCVHSDAIIGNSAREGATILPCRSGGLWDSGVRIHARGQHIATWLIGQVMNEEQALKIDKMMHYAYSIGANIDDYSAAIAQVTVMDVEKFTSISNALYIFAQQLGMLAEQHPMSNRYHTALEQIIQQQSDIAVLYEVWDKMMAEYQQGRLLSH